MTKKSLNSKFFFGKHKGKTVKEVIKSDTLYVRWCIANIDNFELDTKAYNLYKSTFEADFGWVIESEGRQERYRVMENTDPEGKLLVISKEYSQQGELEENNWVILSFINTETGEIIDGDSVELQNWLDTVYDANIHKVHSCTYHNNREIMKIGTKAYPECNNEGIIVTDFEFVLKPYPTWYSFRAGKFYPALYAISEPDYSGHTHFCPTYLRTYSWASD